MRVDTEAPAIRLADYTPPDFLVDSVALTFRLDPRETSVTARLVLRRNPAAAGPADLWLDGRDLELAAARIDGAEVPAGALTREAEGLRVAAAVLPDIPFVWEAETVIAPAANTALEGLYMSGGMYCTQCEAHGFRKITFFPDRPDVMATYSVRIEGDAPVLLSNGNLTASGQGWAEWHDPHPKPSYLFALVAGDLVATEDRFTSASGRDVLLQLWVRPGDDDRTAYAIDALKRSMRWDETEYGREYDLDRYMIVAVDDFNMGAMENKGLNVFNSKYVLASPATATDAEFAGIESIIAHEYFHNWTGNRITCRDWFQLCLKEGLTVFRDQQFSGDMREPGVRRIEDVIRLRAQQFREDAGPLAHPVRPSEYIEINNFYTATVYEKGAELIRMLRSLVGPETYSAALDLYFDRHDGQACTIEDWIAVFEEAAGRDLSAFARWYSQAGTPRLAVTEDWSGGRYGLTFRQHTPPTPGQPDKAPMVIPVAYGLLGPDGQTLAEGMLVVEDTTARFEWELPARPVPSLLRGFSAPVILERDVSDAERAFLLTHDTDPFNRWEAGRAHALDLAVAMAADPAREPDAAWLEAMRSVAGDDALDPAYAALLLGLPPEEEVIGRTAATGGIADPDAIHAARWRLETALAAALADRLEHLYATHAVPGPYNPDAAAAGHRALRHRALALLTLRDPGAGLAERHASAADNMTERMAALALLVRHGRAEAALAEFEATWHHDRLVMDKWFAVQAIHTAADRAAETVAALAEHAAFDWRNPNRFRSLIGAFASSNTAGFHRADGAGYALLADWLIRLDAVNPQTAARMTSAFGSWRMFDLPRQAQMQTALERIAARPDLSRDSAEMVGRLLRTELS